LVALQDTISCTLIMHGDARVGYVPHGPEPAR